MQALKPAEKGFPKPKPLVEAQVKELMYYQGFLISTSSSQTLSKGTGTKPGVPDEVQGCSRAKVDEEEKKDDADDDRSVTPRQGGNAGVNKNDISTTHGV
ncbi:hypothetical protein Tco_0576304 [Tanacetum coccineum]